MGRAHAIAFALAATLAVAGCPGANPEDTTVTPAPVTSPSQGTQASMACDVPTAAPPAETTTPTPPEERASIPVENGTVNATALVERHDRVLREHRYHLEAPDLAVQADPAGPSFRIRARSTLFTVHRYTVAGTMYTYTAGAGSDNPYEVDAYDADSLPDDLESSTSITGRQWLLEALSLGPHRIIDRRSDGRVVLRADDAHPVGEPTASASVGRGSISSLESTVTIDARGIVRSVEQRYEVHQAETTHVVNDTFAVIGVGTAAVERPNWVCVAEREGYLPSA